MHFLGDFFRPAWYDYLAMRDLRPAIVASAAFTRRIARGPAAWIPHPRRGEEDS
jgi:hypothetical protein